jgi:hypothetical protein
MKSRAERNQQCLGTLRGPFPMENGAATADLDPNFGLVHAEHSAHPILARPRSTPTFPELIVNWSIFGEDVLATLTALAHWSPTPPDQ